MSGGPGSGFITAKKYWYMTKMAELGWDKKRRREAMDFAGYSKKIAPAVVDRLVKPHLERAMKRNGITLDKVLKEQARIMTEAQDFNGVPRDNVRLSAIRMAHELLDNFPAKKAQLDVHSKHEETVTITFETIQQIEEYTGEKIIDIPSEDLEIVDKKEEDGDDNKKPDIRPLLI